MPQIEAGETTGSFLIDKRPYAVGAYTITFDDPIKTSTTSNISISQGGSSIADDALSAWTDDVGGSFVDLEAFWDYIGVFFFGGELIPITESTTIVNSATYTILETDIIIHVTYPLIASCVITWPTSLMTSGFSVVIKDGSLNAGTNNIDIETEAAQTIDGDVNWIINGNGDWLEIYSDGANLFITG